MHRVFINGKGWIVIIWGEIIDGPSYVEAASKMINLITSIQHKGQEPVMLIDFSRLKEVTPEAAEYASRATKDLGCKKIAGIGIKPEFQGILDNIKKASTREDIIREFATVEEAEKWLSE